MLCDYCFGQVPTDEKTAVEVVVPELRLPDTVIEAALYHYHYDCWVHILVFAGSGKKEREEKL